MSIPRTSTSGKSFAPAPALCNVDIFGDCVPAPEQYESPLGPPENCLRQGNPCGCGCGKYNTCVGYYCNPRGITSKLDPVDYNGQLVAPYQYCKVGTIPDPGSNTCKPDPRVPFQPWNWKRSLKNYQSF